MADLDVLVLGDANPDLVLRGGDLEPAFGQQEKLVEQATLTVGGSGAIFACACARLGLRTAFVGVLGDDPLGRFMLEELSARNVNVDGCPVVTDKPTGVTVVLSKGADRAMLTFPGTLGDLRVELVDPELLGAARHVHVSSYFLQDALRPDVPDLFRGLRASGATTSIDPNWDPTERWDSGLLETLSDTDLFLPNSTEARKLVGVDDIDILAESLAERGAVVAIKFGQGGGLAIEGSGTMPIHVEAVSVDVVDTTGAGDTFDAGFLAGRLRGWDLERCLQLAVSCGSLSTRASGGTGAQPTLDEALEAVGARMPDEPSGGRE
jgi:sugar/nucleoside kinase (ribokinase family)